MINKKNAVVLFSGGQDSTTCLFWSKERFEKVYALSFNYGQKHSEEIKCASDICKRYNIEHHILKLDLLNSLASNSLTRDEIKVDNHAVEGELPNTFVDGRNMLFLTYAAIFAKDKDINNIVTGVSQSDYSGYPDCRDVFIKSINATLDLAMDYHFILHTPLMWIDKKQTWELADKLGILDIIKNETLTCYNGEIGDGCGNCPACSLRQKGYVKFVESRG